MQPDGKILVGDYSSGRLVRINPDGTSDLTFAPPDDLFRFSAIALQPNGKMIVGTLYGDIARLNADGSRDPTFTFSDRVHNVSSIVMQPNSKIIITISDWFSTSGGTLRLNADGSRDTTFTLPSGVNAGVHTAALQPDGKILIGGDFTTVSGVSRNRMARLNADGSLDPAFAASGGASGSVYALTLQADGKLVIGGAFTTVNTTKRTHIARLHADSSLDTMFLASINSWTTVKALVVQPDGKLIIGGEFRIVTEAGQGYLNIARLNADGTLDPTFNPSWGASDQVRAVALQADGKILIAGDFTSVNGATRSRMARLNADGNLDLTFAPAVGLRGVYAIALQADDQIVIGGDFHEVDGVFVFGMARLHADGSRDSTFAF